MSVFTDVSSRKTRWVESSSPWSRIQRRRARTTSSRSCSEACNTFFVRNALTLQKTEQRRAASGYPALAHRCNDLVQRPVVLLLHQGENLIGVVVQRRTASPAEFGLKSPRLPPRLMPPHSLANANAKAFRRFKSCRSLVDCLYHAFGQIRRIGSGHGTLTKPNRCWRLLPSASLGNPDSARPEPALYGSRGAPPTATEGTHRGVSGGELMASARSIT